jgi:hypothetical protein
MAPDRAVSHRGIVAFDEPLAPVTSEPMPMLSRPRHILRARDHAE